MWENGSNFSAGERQLICLAQAMLRENKIITLDEATASIDFKTEKLIHDVVLTKFADCTVITIAHRLDTILEHDRVLVLDRGEVVEFDDPEVLLKHDHGYLAKYIQSIFVRNKQLRTGSFFMFDAYYKTPSYHKHLNDYQ